MFSRNGANGPASKTTHMFRLVCHMAALVGAGGGRNLPYQTASCLSMASTCGIHAGHGCTVGIPKSGYVLD